MSRSGSLLAMHPWWHRRSSTSIASSVDWPTISRLFFIHQKILKSWMVNPSRSFHTCSWCSNTTTYCQQCIYSISYGCWGLCILLGILLQSWTIVDTIVSLIYLMKVLKPLWWTYCYNFYNMTSIYIYMRLRLIEEIHHDRPVFVLVAESVLLSLDTHFVNI